MKQNNNNNDVNGYVKRGFISRLPFGVKATFIKYWFYGALYFFCFMGLGLVLKNENLVIVTGLIGGALFDIAVYNIFLLFAESREEASKWWFFKSKKLYSMLINIAVIMGMMFAFYYIVVPIRAAIDAKTGGKTWLFGEPLSSALLLIVLDTAICWLKNLVIMAVKAIFKLNSDDKIKGSYIKLLDVSPVSVTFELNNKSGYYTKPYNILLDNEIIFKKVTTNVFTIFDLKPDTQYRLTINRESKMFTTSKISKFYKAYEGNDIQGLIDDADQYSLIVVNKGNYHAKKINLKSNIVLYLRKGSVAHIDETIDIDNLNNLKIIGEGIIDNALSISINRSSNISIVGLTFKCNLNESFSNNINLFNLNANGVDLEGSSLSNIVGIKTNNDITLKTNKTIVKDIFIRDVLIENSDVGIYIKTNVNMGKEAVIKNIDIEGIDMNNVRTPIVMNMYDECDLNKKAIEKPYFGNFMFKNIIAKDYELCAGIFYGLEDKYIEEIKIIDSSFTPKDMCKRAILINGIECQKDGFIVNNVRSLELKHVNVPNISGDKIYAKNVGEIIDN